MIVIYAYAVWAVLLTLLLVRLLNWRPTFALLGTDENVDGTKWPLLLSLLGLGLALGWLPLVAGQSVAAVFYGFFDLPSPLFVLLTSALVFRPQSRCFRVSWVLGGLISLLLTVTYLVGWTWLFEFGYSPWFSGVFLAWFVYFARWRSRTGLVIVLLCTGSALLNLSQSGNGWFAVSDSIWATLVIVSLVINLIAKLWRRVRSLIFR